MCPETSRTLKAKEKLLALVSRIITVKIQCLKHLQDTVVKNILHNYQKESAQATDTVSNTNFLRGTYYIRACPKVVCLRELSVYKYTEFNSIKFKLKFSVLG